MDDIKILLADDHAIVLDGIKQVLNNQANFNVIACCNDGKSVLEALENTVPDVIIMDINMPEMDGLTCSKKVKLLFPNIKIIILTMYPQKSFIEQIMNIGIDGCLLKNNSGKELITAINRVLQGNKYFDLIGSFNSTNDEVVQYKLSEREKEIIKYIIDGLTNAAIAESLFISEHTVKTHRKNIFNKLNVSNTAQLIKIIHQENIF